jgi:hypothetical protein
MNDAKQELYNLIEKLTPNETVFLLEFLKRILQHH